MISPDAELMTCVAYGILPYDTPFLTFAPVTYGCRARPVSTPARTWEVTLEKPLANGNFLFQWGPTVVNVPTDPNLVAVTIDGSSTEAVKQLVMGGGEGFGGDICFAFYEMLKSGES